VAPPRRCGAVRQDRRRIRVRWRLERIADPLSHDEITGGILQRERIEHVPQLVASGGYASGFLRKRRVLVIVPVAKASDGYITAAFAWRHDGEMKPAQRFEVPLGIARPMLSGGARVLRRRM